MGFQRYMACLCLVVLALGCTDTELSNDRYFCSDDIDCKSGYVCHPIEKACVTSGDIPEAGVVEADFADGQTIDIGSEVGGTDGSSDMNVAPPGCENGKRDPGETGSDCGGPCGPCSAGNGCLEPTDCLSLVCTGNICQAPTCGDGIANGDEACDDGNADNTDACNASCEPARCGDGVVWTQLEQCDDGNLDDTDGCRNNCARARCGDGVVQVGVEVCDDGNALANDACTNLCEFARCGDGFVREGFEECDDGNLQDGDGCTNNCFAARCGDGVVQVGVEECDDRNSDNQDGCLNTCRLAICGDGIIYQGVEACDDNNQQTESCDYGETACSVCAADCQLSAGAVRVCGDGIIDPEEECDSAGVETLNCEYGETTCAVCDLSCRLQAGRARFCGDGRVDPEETCDDGNQLAGDGCDEACALESECGNGIVEAGEACDDGNTIDTDICSNRCESYTTNLRFPIEISPCQVRGPRGPEQNDCDSSYGERTVYAARGVQQIVIPQDGWYRIAARGGQGGADGGLGAWVQGDFELKRGEVLRLIAGQEGLTRQRDPTDPSDATGGGGGGTFVFWKEQALLLAAAGGGGGHRGALHPAMGGQSTTAGAEETGSEPPWNSNRPGIDGEAATGSITTAHGGCGYFSGFAGLTVSAEANLSPEFCQSVLNGALGGDASQTFSGVSGGFGGGGLGEWSIGDISGGGGGGGYSGGAGGGARLIGSPGGGGGSFVSGINQRKEAGRERGDGRVNLEFLGTERPQLDDSGGEPDMDEPSDDARLSVELRFESGADFDLHLSHPLAPAWFDRTYDCYFSNEQPNWGEPGPLDDGFLVSDDTGSLLGQRREESTVFAPEETARYGDLPYRVGVHLYDAWAQPSPIATVSIKLNGQRVFEMSKFMEQSEMWTVAEIYWRDGRGVLVPHPPEDQSNICDRDVVPIRVCRF